MLLETLRSPPSAVHLVNVWHDDNVGDTAIALGCLRRVGLVWPGVSRVLSTMLGSDDPSVAGWHRHLDNSYPDVTFVESSFPEPASMHDPVRLSLMTTTARTLGRRLPWLPSRERRNMQQRLGAATALVVVGGSDLFQRRRPLVTASARLQRLLEPALVAIDLGVPVHLWGHTLGPFETRGSRVAITEVLNGAEEVLVREPLSLALGRDLAPAAIIRVVPDFAFPLARARQVAPRPESRFVVLVPRRSVAAAGAASQTIALVASFAETAIALLSAGLVDEVRVVAQVRGPTAPEDDRPVAADVVRLAADKRVILCGNDLGPHETMDLYASAEAVISVRLHGALLALASGTPAFAIAYLTAKTRGIFGMLELEGSWCDYVEFRVEDVLRWWQRTVVGADRQGILERSQRLGAEVLRITPELQSTD